MVLEEEDKEQQDTPTTDNGMKSAGDNRSGDIAVESPDDAKNGENDDDDDDDDKRSEIDGVGNQLESGENGGELLVEKQEQLENNGGEYRFPSPSPSPTGSGSGNGESKDDEAEEEEEQRTERLLVVAKTEMEMDLSPEEKVRPEGVSGTKIESELLHREEEDAMEDEEEEEVGLKILQNQKSFLLEPNSGVEDESGTEEDQVAFMKELEIFHKERCLEFKPPSRFLLTFFISGYGDQWSGLVATNRHGYDRGGINSFVCVKAFNYVTVDCRSYVTSCKLWRQVGESFKPPKTCTTVSWTFRCFYEKVSNKALLFLETPLPKGNALLEYEKYKMSIGELPFTDASSAEPASGGKQANLNQTPGSGRARRDAAARAMQGWHSQRLLGNGEVGDPIIKDKTSSTTLKRDKQSIGLLKRKKPSSVERAVKVARMKASKPQLRYLVYLLAFLLVDSLVVDIGPPADWVKINVQRTKDCFEVYALVPGLLREEVRVQSDPAGRLVISGQPEQLDNPWGVSPFKKVVSLPSRIDPHQTSAVVTLHGQLFVRVPFEQSDL
ncbi:hypothetical protein OSB04_021568 [Centaurea solstitialis]|uniref:SHSP domain-containing protein n=1 Tax=Centaurea solstitialis TaxID=347529 RepID=A0AA38T6H0_9ASTR|nr:hypothetical protein OSB04_021568 [Centaurea solstitialis]